MEGWLYLISSRLFSGRPQKRYFVLDGDCAYCFKSRPVDKNEDGICLGRINSYYRVEDNGRDSFRHRILFVFTIYDPYNREDHLKFGAPSAEEAALWITAFKNAADQGEPIAHREPAGDTLRGGQSYRTSSLGSLDYGSFSSGDLPDWTGVRNRQDGQPDVVTKSPWKIFGCKNGLRLFQETSDQELGSKLHSDDLPAVMAVGTVNSTCESIFATILELGTSRSEWDFCYLRGEVIERLDGHTDIIHKQFHTAWVAWKMKPIDLLLLRYWRREDDGSYAILYQSVEHEKCPPAKGFRRAWLKSGGYVISPLESEQASSSRAVVRHMLDVDWKLQKSCRRSAQAQRISVRVLQRVAALRDMYDALPSTFARRHNVHAVLNRSTYVSTRGPRLPQESRTAQPENGECTPEKPLQLSEVAEEFYDFPETVWEDPATDETLKFEGEEDTELRTEEMPSSTPTKFTGAARLVKRLHELALSAKTAQNRSQIPATKEEKADLLSQQGSLPRCSSSVQQSCWRTPEPDSFRIRGKSYLTNRVKVKAGDPIMRLVACDWIKSSKTESHLASRPGSLLREKGREASGAFFFIINIQVPGATKYSLLLYFMTHSPLETYPLLKTFVEADDRYRNSRFKLIPNIAKGSWIVKQSVGKTACLVGQALEINYYRGDNYLELDVNISSSSVATRVVNLVLGYLGKLVVEMAFLIQANSEEELPEQLLGSCRVVHLDVGKAVAAPAE